MRQFLFSISFLYFFNWSYGQKPLVNDTTYKSWTTVEDGNISSDGKYVYYQVSNKPVGGNTWVILATNKTWETQSEKYSDLNFSHDSKYLYAMRGDSLICIKLGTKEVTSIPHCKGYELYSKNKTDWLIYMLDNAESSLVIQSLNTGHKQVINNIQEYIINKNGATIVSKIRSAVSGLESIQWTELNTHRSIVIYTGMPTRNIIYDKSGNRLAFGTQKDREQMEIWYYERGQKAATCITSDSTSGIADSLKITLDETWRFSGDGKDLFFNLTAKALSRTEKNKGPDIWNYQDLYLLSEYKHKEASLHKSENLSVLNIETRRVRQLLSGDQKVSLGSLNDYSTDVIIIQSSVGKLSELTWNKASHLSYYLCFTKTGKLLPIKENCTNWIDVIALSPDSKFLIYYDPEKLEYLSYNLNMGNTEVISRSLKKELYTVQYAVRSGQGVRETTYGIVGWVKGTKRIVVHGMYDLWELDLENKTPPKNITKGYGDVNHVIFADLENKVLDINSLWLLSAFNMRTKDAEIYSFNYKTGKLVLLFKTASSLSGSPTGQIENLKKAENARSYLLKLGNAQCSPNFVYTTDFKKLDTLSHDFPEKYYNWLTSRIATYKDQSDRECQAILYKPENFDFLKKYPVIFYYYIESANRLNQRISTEPGIIGVNIPILVSNGYIVCMPNIYLETNKPGESALTSILAAADYLKHMTWIDSTKMGIVGHSRGGYETDYIVTHSNRFAAAVSGAGISNLVEYYNTRNGMNGESNHNYVRSQMIMSAGLEDIPNLYNENSPILSVKAVTTPLLLMHNEGDYTVPVTQSTEIFVQLRSQHKPVWLLQYEGEDHIVQNQNAVDLQNKVKDFFDYYLKDRPIPEWMNNPIK